MKVSKVGQIRLSNAPHWYFDMNARLHHLQIASDPLGTTRWNRIPMETDTFPCKTCKFLTTRWTMRIKCMKTTSPKAAVCGLGCGEASPQFPRYGEIARLWLPTS